MGLHNTPNVSCVQLLMETFQISPPHKSALWLCSSLSTLITSILFCRRTKSIVCCCFLLKVRMSYLWQKNNFLSVFTVCFSLWQKKYRDFRLQGVLDSTLNYKMYETVRNRLTLEEATASVREGGMQGITMRDSDEDDNDN